MASPVMTPGYFADDATGFFDGYGDEEPFSGLWNDTEVLTSSTQGEIVEFSRYNVQSDL